ncbi:flagellar biosynthesis protein FlgN [Janthinobacterium sp. CG_23.3]|uniref:flagella synthesis protein FlgN n=1 Tax=unclassified Janthinobacterium TaxID=2610881 RepID=UPI0004761DE1|nr:MULTISPECIES: flagellar protein FlgN [unclassified Janthinobacterium]MEC5162250.1 flagella synthesis protein FlgN [Janthinobacterium sp. CG_S6]
MQSASPLSTLREERELMDALFELMQREQDSLVAAEIDELTALTARKGALVAQLAACAKLRHDALAAAGFAPKEEGMAAWLAGCGDAGATAQWSALLALTRAAKERNRLNGMLVNKQLAHTQGALNSMRPAAQGGNFYGPSGQTTAGAASRRLVIG